MGRFKTITKSIKLEEGTYSLITNESYDQFSEKILNLGDIEAKSTLVNALSVMFDLEGFTNLCKQIDPQLVVPEYLSEFLKWIFQQIKEELTEQKYTEGYRKFASFPLFSKFLGDGLLFIWDTNELSEVNISNIVIAMQNICENYVAKFYSKISKKIVDVPKKLRCGIARGAVYTVGNGEDFVGPCINMSARLQKLNNLSFCFSRRGINPETMNDESQKEFITKKVNIRGIGENEIICILKSEFLKLTSEERKFFS